MFIRILMALTIAFLASSLAAEEPEMGPVIDSFGPTVRVDDRDVPLKKGFQYRAVFDLAVYQGKSGSLNRELVSVARYLNMHARNGVPVENMSLAVVFHGSALKNALSNDAYVRRHGSMNPNLDLLMKLHGAGVEFYACGQSMGFNGFAKTDLASPVKVALSAMTMMTQLQSEGYVLIP